MLRILMTVCVLAPAISPALRAQDATENNPLQEENEQLQREVARLQLQLQALKSGYDARLQEIAERLDALESAKPAAAGQFQMPAPAAAEPAAVPDQASDQQSFSGGGRTLQALNPEISVTGDVTARYSDDTANPEFNRMAFDGFEMAIQHPLDPYSQSKFFVTIEDGEVDLEEGYIDWSSLPGSLGLKVGKFHNEFGKLNRSHKHALPWADRDLPTQTLFGGEGLIGTGVSLSWLPPKLPISQTSETTFEVVTSTNEGAFSGRGFGDPVYVGRLLNYYDLTDDAYFEWGLSAATSHWDLEQQHRSTVLGADLSYRWAPLRRALYRSLELRSEFFYNDRNNSPGGNVFGMYASGEYQLSRRWFAGLRYQFGDSLENNDHHTWGLAPFLTFWQSEWARLRAQYEFRNNNFEDNENRFFIQFTWALGPHKHEAY